ncbi:MAG: MarR family transcriptional regulator [Deferribacteres bacterium]|nr:MarR family transcriptional regulator [Deferribacteres bacterium]
MSGEYVISIVEGMGKVRPYFRKLFSIASDLSDAEILILTLLKSRDGKKVSMSMLYNELHPIKPSKLTQITNKMEDKGLIKKVRSRKDRRRVEIHLTDKGKKALEKYERSIATLLEPLVSDLNTEEVEVLNRSFDIWVKILSRL